MLAHAARQQLLACLADCMRKILSARPKYAKRCIAKMQIHLAVFLHLFGHTKAFAADTLLSLAAAGRLSRNVTFEDIDSVLSPACPTWHMRTHKYALQMRLFTNTKHHGRLSIHLMNGTDYDHSQCPRCNHKGPLYCKIFISFLPVISQPPQCSPRCARSRPTSCSQPGKCASRCRRGACLRATPTT